MALLKCKMCGGDLQLIEGSTVAECQYCFTMQTVPSADNEKKLLLFNRANKLRFGCEFDKAFGVYETIVADFPEEAEAYWGLVLCKYGIEYVDDPATGKKIPTCHRSSFCSVMEDSNFEQALENADAASRKVYRDEAKQIEELRKDILEVSSKADPYDIFICYKETAPDGERTLDSVLAQDIYDALTDKGYRVFFSRISLEDKLGQEYEPYIFAALNSAKVMLAIGTDYEYYNAVWVRNEWSRYLKLMEEDKSKHLIPCFKGIDAYDIPKEFNKLQAQDLGKVGALQDLLRGIDKLISPNTAAVNTPASNLAELLSLGNEALEQGNWNVASNRFDLALMADPKCAAAHLGKLLAEYKCKNLGELGLVKKRVETNGHFQEAMTYADQSLKNDLQACQTKTNALAARQRLFIKLAAIAAAIAIFLLGWLCIDLSYQNTVEGFLSGEIAPSDAYDTFQDFAWYKKDEAYLFLAAAGMGDWNTANQYDHSRIVLTETTNRYLNDYILSAEFNTTEVVTAEFPKGTEYINDFKLSRFSNLSNVIVPEGTLAIGSAFAGCTNITTISLPKSLTAIDAKAFYGCYNLKDIQLPENVATIGKSAFSGCLSLTDIKLPASLTSIDSYAFYGCIRLKSITLPASLTTIGAYAFSDCTALQSITIPASVTEMGKCIFLNCPSLTRIYCEAASQPAGWDAYWKEGLEAEVIWGSRGD